MSLVSHGSFDRVPLSHCVFLLLLSLAVQKTKREARDVRRRVEDREKLRSQRRRQQEENVTRKKRETELHKLDHHAWL